MDIKLLETCERCGANVSLTKGTKANDNGLYAVKRCLECGAPPIEKVARLCSGCKLN